MDEANGRVCNAETGKWRARVPEDDKRPRLLREGEPDIIGDLATLQNLQEILGGEIFEGADSSIDMETLRGYASELSEKKSRKSKTSSRKASSKRASRAVSRKSEKSVKKERSPEEDEEEDASPKKASRKSSKKASRKSSKKVALDEPSAVDLRRAFEECLAQYLAEE